MMKRLTSSRSGSEEPNDGSSPHRIHVPQEVIDAFIDAGGGVSVGGPDDERETIETALSGQGSGDYADQHVPVAVASDLSPDGTFGSTFLLADAERLWVVNGKTGNGDGTLDHTEWAVPQISDVEVEMLVNKSVLVAVVDGKRQELAHFSQSYQRDFHQAARIIESLAEEGKPPDVEQRDEALPRYCEKCGRVLPRPGRPCPACLNRRQVLVRLFSYLGPHRKRVVVLISLLMISAGMETLPPYLTKILIDNVLTVDEVTNIAWFDVTGLGWGPVAWLAIIVTLFLFSRLLLLSMSVLSGRQASWLGPHLIGDLRRDLYHHMERLSLNYFDKHSVGTLLNRIMTDANRVQNFLIGGIPQVALDILMLFMIGAIMLSLNWQLTLAVLIPLPFVMYFSKWFWKYMRSLFHRAWGRRSRLHGLLHDSLNGVRVVKAFGQEDWEINKFDAQNEDLLNAETRAEQTWVTFHPFVRFFSMLGMFIVWYMGGAQVIGETMTLGTLMAFFSYLGMFWRPLQMFTRLNQWVTRDLTAAERLFDVLDTEPDIADESTAVELTDLKGEVRFEDVVFGYDPLRPVIKGITMDIQPGEMVGLVGRSGVGKSTIINLICRFYDPQEGRILIDGEDMRNIRQKDWHRHLGIVPQESFLFNGTIAENIAYANQDARMEEIIRAARAANAHNFIMRFPDGYDERVGNRGSRLSGGERQRIAIARAILHDPKVLILDEATSSLDTETEQQIQEALARLVQGRTVFAIAHRLSTLKNANRLLVIDDGKLAEFGTHDELLERDGTYAALVRAQKELSSMHAVGG